VNRRETSEEDDIDDDALFSSSEVFAFAVVGARGGSGAGGVGE